MWSCQIPVLIMRSYLAAVTCPWCSRYICCCCRSFGCKRPCRCWCPCCCCLPVMFLEYLLLLLSIMLLAPCRCLRPYCSCLSMMIPLCLLFLTSLLLLAPLPVTVETTRTEVMSTACSRDAINSRHNRNIIDKQQHQGDVLADASNRRHTRIIRDKQQQHGVLADSSNRHIPGSSGTSNSSKGMC